MDPFSSVPDDIIFQIALREPIENINRMCLISKRFNNIICNNNYFWNQRFIKDFGLPKEHIASLWRTAYQDYGIMVGFGNNGAGELGIRWGWTISNPTKISNINVKSVSCGGRHTMIIDLNDNVWAFGDNLNGQLGLTFFSSPHKVIPTQIVFKAKSVSCGENHTIVIDLNDNVWAFGSNYFGQLGLGSRSILRPNVSTPTQLPNIKAKAVSCGSNYTMIIDLNDNVWAFGQNNDGQLGLGDNQDRNVPTLLPNIKASIISCGYRHTMIIDLDSNVWAFGNNWYGELGLGDTQDRDVPTLIPNLKAKAVSCGRDYTMIIDLNDNVLAFGHNLNGQLGLGDTQTRFVPTLIANTKAKAVSCGWDHTIIIDLESNVWAFGWNVYGQLGLGDKQDRHIPTQIRNIKAKAVSCGNNQTIVILSLGSQFPSNVYFIPFNEVNRRLARGDFITFFFFPEYQTIPHKSGNSIIAFYSKDRNIYLAEVRYDKTQILPPV